MVRLGKSHHDFGRFAFSRASRRAGIRPRIAQSRRGTLRAGLGRRTRRRDGTRSGRSHTTSENRARGSRLEGFLHGSAEVQSGEVEDELVAVSKKQFIVKSPCPLGTPLGTTRRAFSHRSKAIHTRRSRNRFKGEVGEDRLSATADQRDFEAPFEEASGPGLADRWSTGYAARAGDAGRRPRARAEVPSLRRKGAQDRRRAREVTGGRTRPASSALR